MFRKDYSNKEGRKERKKQDKGFAFFFFSLFLVKTFTFSKLQVLSLNGYIMLL